MTERTNDWIREHRVGDTEEIRARLVGIGPGRVAARMFPEADPDRLQVMADMCFAFGYVVDDLIDDLQQDTDHLTVRLNRLLWVLEHPMSPPLDDDPLAAALVDLRTRLAALATPGQLDRLAQAWRRLVCTGLWERSLSGHGRVPDMDEAVAVRIQAMGLDVTSWFCDVVGAYRVDVEEMLTPAGRALLEAAALVFAWDNDIVSHAKDEADGMTHNLLTVVAHQHGWDLPRALTHGVDLRNQAMTMFMRLRERLHREGSPALRLYLRDVGRQLAALTHHWRTSARYRRPTGSSTADHLPELAENRDPTIPELGAPPPIAAISWWWDVV